MKQLKPPLTSCTRLAVALCYWSRTELVTAGVGASGMPACCQSGYWDLLEACKHTTSLLVPHWHNRPRAAGRHMCLLPTDVGAAGTSGLQ